MNKEWSRSTRWRIICFQRRYSDKWLNKLQLRCVNLCISLCLNIVGDIWGDVWLHSLELWLEPTPELMYKVTWAPGCSTITACKCGERRKIIHLGYLLHRGRFSTHTHTHTHTPAQLSHKSHWLWKTHLSPHNKCQIASVLVIHALQNKQTTYCGWFCCTCKPLWNVNIIRILWRRISTKLQESQTAIV